MTPSLHRHARRHVQSHPHPHPHPYLHRHPLALAVLLLSAATGAGAQNAPPQETPSLKEVTVTGNPLGAADLIAPSASYSGTGLLLRSRTTLGETLDGTPGVSSTYFGPNASRPIVRGLDGDRIRILQNSGASIDASALSFDHAVPADPLSIERIEVLRGPAALLYGGSAVGGVVNVIDNRIPRERLFDARGGVSGKVDFGAASGNKEKGGGFLLETGNDRYALHADVFSRSTGDVKVPVALDCSKPGAPSRAERICNSASETRGGALGGTLFFDKGYLGASVASYRSDYGTVAEDEVTIGMRSLRYALEGELTGLRGAVRSLKGQLSHTDYRHTEFEGGQVGTVFRNRGNDLRLEARHAPLGRLEGVIGLQAESNRFSADGEEAFAPFSRTAQNALFILEELGTPWGKLSFGARSERVRVESFGNPDPEVDRFTPGRRSFRPSSAALGALVNLAPAWQWTTNLAYTERAPKDYELFANGPHLATAAWETGDATLAKERSTSLDLGLAWKSGAHKFAVNAYTHRFANFIGLQATGGTRGANGEANPVDADGDGVADGSGEPILDDTRYRGVRARFNGLEASGTVRLQGPGGLRGAPGAAQATSSATWDLEWRADRVRATNLDTGEPLPRIAPMRVGATLAWSEGPWGARFGFDHSAAQRRVPTVGQRETDAYTLWNASLSYRMKAGPASLLWYARLDNITDQLAYSAASVLTTTAFPKSPLPGRSFKVGLQAMF